MSITANAAVFRVFSSSLRPQTKNNVDDLFFGQQKWLCPAEVLRLRTINLVLSKLTYATQIGIVKRQSLLSYVTKLALSEGTSATLCNKFGVI